MTGKRVILGITGGFFLTLIACFTFQLPRSERFLFENLINRNARVFFEDSIRIEKVTIDRDFKIRLQGITGSFKTRQGPVALEIRSIESREPLYSLLGTKPVYFVFEGARPKGSPRSGLFGEISITAGKDWCVETSADFGNTDLEDLRWLDSQDLDGAYGAMNGKFTFVQVAGREPVLELRVAVPQPGGKLQARFFDLFLPYLPGSLQRDRVAKLVSEKSRLVRYQTAALEMSLPRSDRLKILLRILVLDYNLSLTLNMTVRTDQKGSFSQIARIMGLIEAKGS